jgi:hypothetical protein
MRILIGSPVKQDETIFKYYLQSLASLKCDYEIDWFFILHNSPELKKYLNKNQYEEFTNKTQYEVNSTHHWKKENLKDVTNMKNYLLHKTLQEGYDYFFLVDSDIMLHPKTLQHLVMQNHPIISEIFWTSWNPGEEPMPNAWDYDFYGYAKEKDWRKYKQKEVWKVGYSGACILIHRDVIAAGVNYNPIHNVSFSAWEDRAFCIRAAVHGFQVTMDTHYPATHLYRKEDVQKYEIHRQTQIPQQIR